jgi:hypothetical protein
VAPRSETPSRIVSIQAPAAVVMVRPRHFHPNPQTAADNAFQREASGSAAQDVAQRAYDEVTEAAASLERHGVRVHLFDDGLANSPAMRSNSRVATGVCWPCRRAPWRA